MSIGHVTPALAKTKMLVQPIQLEGESVRYRQGTATVALFKDRGSVQIEPLPLDHGSLAFFVVVFNSSDEPANIDITNFTAQSGKQQIAAFSVEELQKRAKNRAMWSQIGIAALGGLAAAGAASQRDTYRGALYTPHGVYRSVYSAPSTAGQIQAAAITAGTGYAVYDIQRNLDRTRRELADSVVQLSTIDPGRSYGGKIVLAKLKDKQLPNKIDLDLKWNGEDYPFSFQLAKPGTPAPVFTELRTAEEFGKRPVQPNAMSASEAIQSEIEAPATATQQAEASVGAEQDADVAVAATQTAEPVAAPDQQSSKIDAEPLFDR